MILYINIMIQNPGECCNHNNQNFVTTGISKNVAQTVTQHYTAPFSRIFQIFLGFTGFSSLIILILQI